MPYLAQSGTMISGVNAPRSGRQTALRILWHGSRKPPNAVQGLSSSAFTRVADQSVMRLAASGLRLP
jgi:hypothetical protein